MPSSASAFTLRFRRPQTHAALRVASSELGLSMNELAERAIEHELAVAGIELEDRLREAIELLRGFRRDEARDAAAFAGAEVTERDPLQSRASRVQTDPLGVAKLFGEGDL